MGAAALQAFGVDPGAPVSERTIRVSGALAALAVLTLAAHREGDATAWRPQIVATCFDALGHRRPAHRLSPSPTSWSPDPHGCPVVTTRCLLAPPPDGRRGLLARRPRGRRRGRRDARRQTSNSFSIPGQESTTALERISEEFGAGRGRGRAGRDARPGRRDHDLPENAAAVADLVGALAELPGVASATDPLDPAAPAVNADQEPGLQHGHLRGPRPAR